MNKLLRKGFAVILALLFLPFSSALSETEPELICVSAERIFTEERQYVQLLVNHDNCYISLPEAGKLLGAQITTGEGFSCTFSGAYSKRTVYPREMDSILYQETYYYRLEQLMQGLSVHVHASDGVLFLHDPWYNLDEYLSLLDEILQNDTFDANMLNSNIWTSIFGDVIYTIANVYDAIREQRIDVLWGGAYRKDARELLLELVSPVENEGFNLNIFSGIGKANQSLRKAAKYILKAENDYENARELLLDIPMGSDTLLFGVSGTSSLRELLDAVQAVNHLNLSNIILSAKMNYAEWSDYQEAIKELNLELSPEINMLSISDLISIESYCVDVLNKDSALLNALSAVLDAVYSGRYLGSDGLIGSMERQYIYEEAEKIAELWAIHQSEETAELLHNVNHVLGFLIREGGGVALDHSLSDIFSAEILGTKGAIELRIGIEIVTKAVDGFAQALGVKDYSTVKNMDAVRRMYILSQIQKLFEECIRQSIEKPSLEDFKLLQGAGELYLKCAWMVSEGFLDNYLKSAEGLAKRMMEQMEGRMAELFSYPENMFAVADTDIVSASQLRDQAENYRNSILLSSSYVKTYYFDSGSFYAETGGLDGAEVFQYSYQVPEIISGGFGARSINQKIRDCFDHYNYISGTMESHILHSEDGLVRFGKELAGDQNVLLSMTYDHTVWNGKILSLQLKRQTYDTWSWRYSNETTAYNLDLNTGNTLDGELFLSIYGISEFELWRRARAIMINRCTELWTTLEWEYYPGYEEDLENARLTTLSWNTMEDLLERGFFITQDGHLQVSTYLCNGAADTFETVIEIDPNAPPEEILDAVFTERAFPEEGDPQSPAQASSDASVSVDNSLQWNDATDFDGQLEPGEQPEQSEFLPFWPDANGQTLVFPDSPPPKKQESTGAPSVVYTLSGNGQLAEYYYDASGLLRYVCGCTGGMDDYELALANLIQPFPAINSFTFAAQLLDDNGRIKWLDGLFEPENITLSYDSSGSMTFSIPERWDEPDEGGAVSGQPAQTYQVFYDDDGKISAIHVSTDYGEIASFVFVYDDLTGKLLSLSILDQSGIQLYAYQFTYDGGLISHAAEYGMDPLVPTQTIDYTYEQGRRVSAVKRTYAEGAVVSEETVDYRYTFIKDLLQYAERAVNGEKAESITIYYDDKGRIIAFYRHSFQHEGEEEKMSLESAVSYFYDENGFLLEMFYSGWSDGLKFDWIDASYSFTRGEHGVLLSVTRCDSVDPSILETAPLPQEAPADDLRPENGEAFRVECEFVTFTFPADWAGKYEILTPDVGIVEVFNKANYEAGCSGHLFTVYATTRVRSNMQLLDYSIGREFQHENFSHIVGCYLFNDWFWSQGLVFVLTDGNYSFSHIDAALADDYVDMFLDIGDVLQTMQINHGALESIADTLETRERENPDWPFYPSGTVEAMELPLTLP